MLKEKKVRIFDPEIIKEGHVITLDQYQINTTGYDDDEDYKVSWEYTGSITGVIVAASEERVKVLCSSPWELGCTNEYNIGINEVVEGDTLPESTVRSYMYSIVGVTNRVKGISV
ncbi:hypothetical protein Grass_145 [Bacillus phage Grass]|uniref:Uncharacterized protein n=1 Tax=Bacillus phage Grass TaxID=1406785 RepID=U5PTV8_BPGRA|nr:hypothetical protein Grass_145 [Bacillus phage Grass]AGY47410.1 hypothetical protein Grass_145 [Bacillus phage Grass]